MTILHAVPDETVATRPSKIRSPQKLPQPSFVEVATGDAALPFVDAWERLAEAPLERNVFAEPWMLIPACEHLDYGEKARVGLVFDPNSSELLGVFPFVRSPRWNRLPITAVSGWIHEQSYLGTPLLSKDPVRAKQALHGFFEAQRAASLVEFNDVAGDGEFMQLLTEVINERQLDWFLAHSVTRPVLCPRASADAYLAEALDGDARRKLRAKERGLAAVGGIRSELVETARALEAWIVDFVRLEVSGWKGKQSSALYYNPEARSYFEAIVRDGFRRGRVMALTMRAGDRIAAMKLNLRSGDEWYAFKIAYEQDLARFSPGLQLEVENIRRVHALGDVRRMDSCTGPSVRVFRDVWLDRRSIQTLVVATGQGAGALALASLPLLRWAKRKVQAFVVHPEGHANYKPPPRQIAALPLASRASLSKRIAVSPLAMAVSRVAGAGRGPGDLGTLVGHAVRLQCARIGTEEFHDHLDAFFAGVDLDRLLRALDYESIRPALLESDEYFVVHRVKGPWAVAWATRAAGYLSIRFDFARLRAGEQAPAHGHQRSVSGFCVVEGSVAVRRYELVESLPDSLTLRPTFDGVLARGDSSTESDARDNVHWIVALEDTVLFRVTVSHTPRRHMVATSLNLWIDPRSPVRGDGLILGKWLPEEAARRLPPFTRGRRARREP